MKTKYLIVGAGAAGMAAAQSISESDPGGSIIILSDENVRPYYRPLIPYIMSGRKKLDDILLEGKGPYTAKTATVRPGSRVAAIDTGNKCVTAGAEQYEYEKLLLATGSRPKIPGDMRGTDCEGVFTLRFYSDATGMASRCTPSGHAVMAGGGLLNLKAAFALRETGMDITLVVKSPAILSQLMEPEDSYLIRDAILEAGIKILPGRNVQEVISGPKGVKGVALDDGSELPCEIVCIGKGVEPVIDYLDKSGIKTDVGIVADDFTMASKKDVFTAGDAAVTYNPVTKEPVLTALWTNAVEMGRCAGRNMAGLKTAYTGAIGILNATQIGNLPFVSMGTVHTKETDFETHVKANGSSYEKVVFSKDGNNLVGALFIGDITRAGLYRYIIRESRPVKELKSFIIGHTLHYGHCLEH